MKNMNKMLIVLSLFFFLGIGKGNSATVGWFTSHSSGVIVTTQVPVAITQIKMATGSLTDYILLIDTNSLVGSTFTASGYPAITAYNKSRWMCPQLQFVDAATYTNVRAPATVDFPDDGVSARYGVFLFGVTNGNTVTIYLKSYSYVDRAGNLISSDEVMARVEDTLKKQGIELSWLDKRNYKDLK